MNRILDMNLLKQSFQSVKQKAPEKSLDELLYETFNSVKKDETDSFDEIRSLILEANGINEYEYYTRNVSPDLKKYIEEAVFPQYDKNDKAHGIIHIKEVIRRAFALKDTLKQYLGELEDDLVFAITACHDLGKYIDHETHEKIAANIFINDENMKKFFNEEQRTTIKEAIEDHRSSHKDNPRSKYGELVSSADRNTRIEIVFMRSFFVGKARTPDMTIEDFLDFTFKRLSKRYGEENPENMFLEDKTYEVFLNDMRDLLQNEAEFKSKYCKVNHIQSRNNILSNELGAIEYYQNKSSEPAMFKKGDLCKHFKGKSLKEKNIYEILEMGVKYSGDASENPIDNLVVYKNIFQGKIFAREYKDLVQELSPEKQEEFKQKYRVQKLTPEEEAEVRKRLDSQNVEK